MGPLFFHAWPPTHAKFILLRAQTRSAKHIGANKAITAYRPEIKDIGKKTSTAKTFHSKPRSSRPESQNGDAARPECRRCRPCARRVAAPQRLATGMSR